MFDMISWYMYHWASSIGRHSAWWSLADRLLARNVQCAHSQVYFILTAAITIKIAICTQYSRCTVITTLPMVDEKQSHSQRYTYTEIVEMIRFIFSFHLFCCVSFATIYTLCLVDLRWFIENLSHICRYSESNGKQKRHTQKKDDDE